MPLLNAQLQEQIEIEGEMEQNHVLLEEREQDIKEIQLQIGEVTEIFQDLAVLVSEQGEVRGSVCESVCMGVCGKE